MGVIVYQEQSLLDAKTNIEKCNSEILESLEKIYYELENMEQTLSTPRTKKYIPIYMDYVSQKIDYIRHMRENYNIMLDTINNEYRNYSNTVSKMVGDKHD